jgi:subtilisin family serine protease
MRGAFNRRIAGAVIALLFSWEAWPGPPRAKSKFIHVLVELQQPSTVAHYQTQLETKPESTARAAAVTHLTAVRAEQITFQKTMASAKIAGVHEIYRLQRLFNGILYVVPKESLKSIKTLPGVKAVHLISPQRLSTAHAIPFVGVPRVWSLNGTGFHGEGMRVGIIDTGIDYTHANFGGPGTVAAFNANDPTVIEAGTFPTAKVVGGLDFAGSIYDAFSDDPAAFTPMPDADPIDIAGHGSHVAGILSGFGVSNDGTTFTGAYDASLDTVAMRIGPGAAPLASLYALKVFGDEPDGTTALTALAMEWAVDPNQDALLGLFLLLRRKRALA